MPGGYKKIQDWIDEDPERAKEVKKLAGKKSGEARRKKKAMRDYLSNLLLMKTETGDLYTDITIALIDKALEGDVKAYHEIRDALGEAIQQMELTGNKITVNITEEE